MGTEVEAFLGPLEAVSAWKDHLKSVVVFRLPFELGLVPATGELLRELRERYRTPAESDGEVAQRWGREASTARKIVYFTVFEFGDESREAVVAWRDQQLTGGIATVEGALEFLGARGVGAELGRYKKTHLWAAAAVLQEFENRGRAGILEALKHRSEYVRRLAADKLGGFRGEPAAAIPSLVEMARNDPSYGGRLRATAALGALGPASVPVLKGLLAPGVLQDRWGTMLTLGRLGAAASAAVPELIQILKTEPDEKQRAEAAETLGKIGEGAAVAIPALIEALRDGDEHVRYHAVAALGKMGPLAIEALPALRRALQDSYSEVPWAAIVSLGQIGPFPLPEVIATLRTRPSWFVRCEAAKALGARGKEAAGAIPALMEALGDQDPLVRSNAAEALGMMGAAAKDALPGLRRALEDSCSRIAAARAIQRIQSDRS